MSPRGNCAFENSLITCVKQHGGLPNDKPLANGDKASKTGGDVNTKDVTEGNYVDGKDSVSTALKSTLSALSPTPLTYSSSSTRKLWR